MHENALSQIIVDSAIEVHRVLGGPGLNDRFSKDVVIVQSDFDQRERLLQSLILSQSKAGQPRD